MQIPNARDLKQVLSLRAELDDWAGRGSEPVEFAENGTPRDPTLTELNWEFPWSDIMEMLRVLRSEYIEQLAAQLGSEPLVRKLAVVDQVLTTARFG